MIRSILAVEQAAPEPNPKANGPWELTVRRKSYLGGDDGRCEAVVGDGEGIGVARKDLKERANGPWKRE